MDSAAKPKRNHVLPATVADEAAAATFWTELASLFVFVVVAVGRAVGLADGIAEGLFVGMNEGMVVGSLVVGDEVVGRNDGIAVGMVVGLLVSPSHSAGMLDGGHSFADVEM